MAVVPLASQEDVEAILGRVLTSAEEAKVDAILDKASELFRRRSRQQFTAGTSLVRLKVTADYVNLPQRPVVSVESVTRDVAGGAAVSFDLFQSRLTLRGVRAGDMVRVAYTHGGDVPELVRLTIADVARKVLLIDPNAATGLTQYSETNGPFTEQYTYATWAQGGETRLAPEDLVIADSFRVKTYGSIVLSSDPPSSDSLFTGAT